MSGKDTKQISIPIPSSLHRRLKIQVAREGILVKDLVIEAIQNELRRRELKRGL